MLQQTQVATVVPYYERWMAALPTVAAMAAEPLERVFKLWEGLGYYSRARNLHRAAGVVVERHGGAVPASFEALRALPGVGDYTAGAIASIAFGLREPVLDGNVARVLCRVLAETAEAKSPRVRKALLAEARVLLPARSAGDFNQAMMELGATVCTPRSPACLAGGRKCPISGVCEAFRQGRQEALPTVARRPAVPHYEVVVGVIVKAGRVLIDRRPAGGLLGGLWEFPGGKIKRGETHGQALKREAREEVGVEIEVGERIAVVPHAYSHFRVTIHAYRARWKAGRAKAIQCDKVKWVRLSELSQYAMPRANRKIIEALTG
jgi:A/G-specific adenine glycosylase